MSQKHLSQGSSFPPLRSGVIRLYSMRFCPYSQRVRLVLAYKWLRYETINIHLKNKPDWFLRKNPQGTVPVLEVDNKILYESTAICEWIDDVYTRNHLQPLDPYRKALDRILLEYSSKLNSSFFTLLSTPREIDKVAEDLRKHYMYFNEALNRRGGPYFGDRFPAMIDFYVWPFFERLQAFSTRYRNIYIDRSKYPKLAQWLDAMGRVPAVQEAHTDTRTLLHYMDSVTAGNPDYMD